jgi:S1-C subfamily serine protease
MVDGVRVGLGWGMRALKSVSLAAALAMAASASAAQQWIASGDTKSDHFETDLHSVNLKGDVVDVWLRRTPVRAQRDEKTGKLYASEIVKQYNDCANRRFAYGDFVRRDGGGETIGSGDINSGWHDFVPGSISETTWRLACAVGKPPTDKPLLGDIWSGDWISAGPSADGTHTLSFKLDEIATIQKGVVVSVARADYPKPILVAGFPVRSIVSAAAVDCARRESAGLGADVYITRSLRVSSERTADDKINFEAIPPGSFLFKHLTEVCANADKAPASAKQAEAGSYFTGTAWGVDKGYLVTASHVITDAERIGVFDNGVLLGEATVVADDPTNDVAVLRFKPKHPGKLPILQIATRPAVLGRRVITLGYPEPDNLGQRIKVTSGEVSSTAGYQDDPRYLQVSIPFQPGNSGGPVIAADGSVLGVAQSKLIAFNKGGGHDDPPPEMVNYAVKTSYIRPLLEDLPDLGNYVVVHPTPGADDLVAQARRAVFMLIVERQPTAE